MNTTALITFVIVTTFTPGPNNIAAAAMGINFGYSKTFRFLLGIASGFFLVMLACALLSTALSEVLPRIQSPLRWAGSLYILWLSVGVARASYAFDDGEQAPKAFGTGFFLQLFNPKVAVYGLTLYAGFLAPHALGPGLLTALALVFAGTAFAATSCSRQPWSIRQPPCQDSWT